MARGQIARWIFANNINNHGTISGCFDVQGLPFFFTIEDVTDPALASDLRLTPNINRNPNCASGPNKFWVQFQPVGARATSISRLFP